MILLARITETFIKWQFITVKSTLLDPISFLEQSIDKTNAEQNALKLDPTTASKS